jgi:hypothetical protein
MGRAVDSELMIGRHELSCGMMDMDASCESTGTNIMAPGCCDNKFISVEIEDDYQIVESEINLDANFLFAFAYTFLLTSPQGTEPFMGILDKHPPPLEEDFQSLYQSFLL